METEEKLTSEIELDFQEKQGKGTEQSRSESSGGERVEDKIWKAGKSRSEHLDEDHIFEVGVRLRIEQLSYVSTVDQRYAIEGAIDFDWEAAEDEIELFAKVGKANFKPIHFDAPLTLRNDIESTVSKVIYYLR